ncbi:MAG: M23 family metallopeptidase [Rubrivivax sp.]|nr:M23 family metallopeptidase [Rubrivivax sp.]MDP3222506.1 M23 family metallopeptidase [Rubrivivax sp.]MDP3610741.1 M23 family metallopeptidase [Rubrivivax sp.]
MQVLITHGTMARTRVLQFQRWQLLVGAAALAVVMMAASGSIYHFIFLKAAREGWPVVSSLVRLIVRDEIAQRDRFMRENLDAMAQKVGEMRAKLVKLEAMGDRVSGLAGMKPEDLVPLRRSEDAASGAATGAAGGEAPSAANGTGGPYVPAQHLSLEQLQTLVSGLDEATDLHTDLFTFYESRLQESRLTALLVPSAAPVIGPVGSGFGFRTDPFNGRAALHTGLDFPAEVGTPILAAAGGMVVTREWHPGYGQLLEIDHGNGLLTRYAHCSSIEVEVGALVKRGQQVAKVGNTGRSTGSHLHFEVLLEGVPQNPARFLGRQARPMLEFAARPGQR